MDITALKIFLAVAETGGVTRAAEKLHYVQSNVTARLKQLEEDLGTPLFYRNGRKLQITPAGQILSGYAERILRLTEEARQAVQDSPEPRGRSKPRDSRFRESFSRRLPHSEHLRCR